jgi:hypothetical protein
LVKEASVRIVGGTGRVVREVKVVSVIYVETRHMLAVLKAQINKTGRNDARGIAQMSGALTPLSWIV